MDMEKLVSLCRRRGFIFQSSEIYGGINGFWDYGPLGVELKKNIKDAWWQDMVRNPPPGPDGQEISMVGRGLRDHHEPEGVGGERACRRVSAIRWWIARSARSGIGPTRSCRRCSSIASGRMFIRCRRRCRRREFKSVHRRRRAKLQTSKQEASRADVPIGSATSRLTSPNAENVAMSRARMSMSRARSPSRAHST